jgi:two-component system, NtrC family, sensor histidine kinase HydH
MKNRIQKHFHDSLLKLQRSTDDLFTRLIFFQWITTMILAFWHTPLLINEDSWNIHPHIYVSIFMGGTLSILSYFIVKRRPDASSNKYVITVAQSFFSIMIIYLSAGRIESHFHIFGSMAFLAMYRTPGVIFLTSAIAILDHIVRGIFWPMTIFHIPDASVGRSLEHAAWIIFEAGFLYQLIRLNLKELELTARKTSELELLILSNEELINFKTAQIELGEDKIIQQRQSIIQAERLSGLGELASGIAHEINNPLAVINGTTTYLRRQLSKGAMEPKKVIELLSDIETTVGRISTIIGSLRRVSTSDSVLRHSSSDVNDTICDVLRICAHRLKKSEIPINVIEDRLCTPSWPQIKREELSQVLLNLILNAIDAVEAKDNKWIRIELRDTTSELEIRVLNSGPAIPAFIQSKMFLPFFTSKEVGRGTGLGLTLSKSIIEKAAGSLRYDVNSSTPCFVIQLPLALELRGSA